MSKKNAKAKTVQVDERAKHFVDAVAAYLSEASGNFEIDGDDIYFWASVGLREFTVCCWFEPATSQAHISMFAEDIFPGALAPELAAYMQTVLAVPRKVGGKLAIGKEGDVTWNSFCQVTPATRLDQSLATEVIKVGITEFNRLMDVLSAFVEGRVSVGENNRLFSPSSFAKADADKDELLN